MCKLAMRTDGSFQQHFMFDARASRRRGSALIGTFVIGIALVGLVWASVSLSRVEVQDSRRNIDAVRARQTANAGVERALHFLGDAASNAGTLNPIDMLGNLFLAEPTITPFVAEPLMNGASQVGAFTTTLTLVDQTPSTITVLVRASGYVPEAPTAGGRVDAWGAVETTVRYSLAPSEVFDYGYFINNWGWFYGDTIISNGNIRSNGQFDVAGYKPEANTQPMYDSVAVSGGTAALSGYREDNGDGVADGNDGGIFAGWDLAGTQNVRGTSSAAKNQHEFVDQVPMPNLTNLAPYEARATAAASSITVGGVVYSDAVFGDEVGEQQNLYLVGTAANPIVLNGPVVVRGNVVIHGYVTGQGAIYSGGNVFCPNSVRYVNPPTTARPSDNSTATTDAWLSTNWNKDFLGLFARENVVVGDFTHGWWQHYVSGWMGSSLNKSEEDAGADGIPNTRAGRDGVLGTADDDVLEDDNQFTIEHYTDAHSLLGLIPPGADVGDPIPGTGEDIDGDGVYDAGATLANVTLATALNSTNFGGNLPGGGIPSYSTIATLYANQFDAVFYTNHSFCWLVLGGTAARINGALVSRNENIVYGTPTLETNYDCRLLGGATGMAAGLLPVTLQAPEILRWVTLDRDPNRYAVTP